MKRLKASKISVALLWLFCWSFYSTDAQAFEDYPGFSPLSNIVQFKAQFKEASAKIQSVKSEFIQEKTLFALTENITSQGKFWFKRTNKVRLDYTTPFTYRMIINGDKVLVKDDHKENRINVRSNKLFQQINKIMLDCIQGTILDSKDFTSRVFENEKGYLLELSPVNKSLKDFFRNIVLVIEKKDYSVRSMSLNEPSGDKTVITFTNKSLNTQLQDEIFTF
ncbi:outer membrane lipoprotein carrier protein LolA [Pseudochryseolinea flava]|uniref:Outer membrane lipoprotein carrier protein LolA n=1 Tax=Pseudochryseolinea flava TaxID=2059302 RepID=A0A364Y0P2_9BACT|nr:outer membrane lipoprotein carrier protein LolA [Pseudochryseolinea flava]RAW00151.1 outer membrane lipoprotein carrier protein LolA [Pseudochryseolinea flava]